MSTFVDTSALIALLIREDENHGPAGKICKKLGERDEPLLTSNYVLVETLALLQRRSGVAAARVFVADVLPILRVEWVDARLHEAGTQSMLMAGKSGPSIVDCVNFALLRDLGIQKVFAFDRHFKAQGFRLTTA